MTCLRSISTTYERVEVHVIFVHGLSGHIENTWRSTAPDSSELWPLWLEGDVPNIGLWLVGFPAAMTNWGGYAISIPDRAESILARLLAEPDLGRGNIIFVAHSLGGLVVKQILRNAERQTGYDQRVSAFLARVRRVAFLGTPHRGALLASLSKALSPLIRPSAATSDLILGAPQIRDLNLWYRHYSWDNRIGNLILAEGRPMDLFGVSLPNLFGKVVSVDSADAGLLDTPIVVDEGHASISKPLDRSAEVYVHVRDFIRRPHTSQLQVTRIDEAIERNTKELETLTSRTEEQSAAIAELKHTIIEGTASHEPRATIMDAEIDRRLERIRKCRFFGEFAVLGETRSLVATLEEGDLVQASNEKKETALAWCARFLAGDNAAEAESILDRIGFENPEIYGIARSAVRASSGGLELAIRDLCAIGTPLAYGAAYIQLLRIKGIEGANEWLEKAGLRFADLDSDAKFLYIRKALEDCNWDIAFDAAERLVDEDWERTPGLLIAGADAFLMQAVPNELRETFLAQALPFDAQKFPLRSESFAMEWRRTAIRLYDRFHSEAKSLGLMGIAGLSVDKALWLRLVDSEHTVGARRELVESLNEPSTLLRRLGFALQFGANVDLEWAEREVDRQTALSGGMSSDAAFARLALALSKESHADVAAYMNEHREQLFRHLDPKGLYFIEIEMLASAGRTAKAEERLEEAKSSGLSDRDVARLRRELTEASGGDPISERLAAYEENQSIIELRLLVNAYEDAEDWLKVCEFGTTLLELSGDLSDVRRHVIALYKCERHEEAIAVMETFPAVLGQDDRISLLRAQLLFECGRLSDALTAVNELRRVCDSPEARQLQINLAVVSGDWDSLQGFVEAEWVARSERTAIDLLRTGQIAVHIGAGRAIELVRTAAERSPDDPNVLVGCYHLATTAGWEVDVEAHVWMQRAVELSGGDGPVQMVTIKELFERKPDWERQESNVWGLLEQGDTPIFAAGRLLNRSLLSLYLMPALGNMEEPDVRRRAMVFAFSGARGTHKVHPNTVAMEATALITTEFLGLLEVCIEAFDNIVIPHSTLGWLLEEKARILFHQPSRVVAARELQKMIADGHLHAFDGSSVPPERLVNEVGPSLAELLAEASSSEHSDTRQRLAVRGGPVHKASSLMEEDADLSTYHDYLCSGISVIQKLVQKGVLTRSEAEEARGALKVREVPWPNEPTIADGAIIFLDDLATSHLQFLGLLPKLYRADLTVFVSRSEIDEADALISYDVKTNDVVSIVDRLRQRLREGLEDGKVRLGVMARSDNGDDPKHVSSHPTVDMLKLVSDADVGVVDDRYMNQHASISLESGSRPLLSTVDLLDVLVERGAISEDQRQNALTTLRRANFALTPVTAGELNTLFASSTVCDGVLEETGELKAIREGVQRVRMCNILQSPKELAWLNGVTQACLSSLKEQWKDGVDEATAIARSNWLIDLSDVRSWTHRLDENVEQLMERYCSWVLVLMMLPATQPQSVKEAYWRWFDLRVLEPLQEEEPATYRSLVEWAKEHVAKIVENCEQLLEANDE